MAHSLIGGMTESGKTTLAKRMAAEYKKAGYGILVLDPMVSTDWGADFISADPDEFLDVYWKSQQCAVFIDEAGDHAGQFDKAMHKTATKGRHWGHMNHYLTQRAQMISPNIRNNCSRLFLFSMALEDCKILSREWNDKTILEAANLPQGHYLHGGRFGEFNKSRLW